MVTYLVRDRILLFSVGLILLFVVGLVKPVSAVSDVTVSLSANPSSITVTAGSSASTTITVTFSTIASAIPDGIAFQILNPVISCSGLPAGATCSTDPNPLPSPMNSGQEFTLTVSASSSTSPGTYQVTVQISYQSGFLAISPIQFGSSGGFGPSAISISQAILTNPITITVVVNPPFLITGVDAGSGSVSPNCPAPSGCSETVGSSQTVTATPSSGWLFSSWSTQTGISCSSNSCVFAMPANNVVLGATFIQVHAVHQTPVGGVMLPGVGFSVLLPWAIVLSLLGVLSVEAFTIKRRAKQR